MNLRLRDSFERFHDAVRRARCRVRLARIEFHCLRRAIMSLLRDPGSKRLKGRSYKRMMQAHRRGGYRRAWFEPSKAKRLLQRCTRKPLISVVVPVYRTPLKWLSRCIGSVRAQYYKNWGLVLVDDGSGTRKITRALDAWASKDERIRVRHLQHNVGISAATNTGIDMARGEFVAFLDHDDEVTPDALTWIVLAINAHPDVLWLYSDEATISADGNVSRPSFKPGFDPFLLLSVMYTCHLSVYATSVLRQAGGFRRGFEGSQDHDLALRLSEIVPRDRVVHIPRVLYRWRNVPTSAAVNVDAKPYAAAAGRKAVVEALRRRNLQGAVESHPLRPTVYSVRLRPRNCPKVSILLPTRNAFGLVRKCVNSVRSHTHCPDYEIVVIDNQSTDPDLLEYLEEQEASGRPLRTMRYDKPFNHSEMSNIAVEQVDSEYVILLNNDVEILSDDWIEQMVATAQIDPAIAGVGALLVYPDGRVQHGGIILGVGGAAGHAHKRLHKDALGYLGLLHCIREMSGVTGALTLLRRAAFLRVGGFNAERYPATFNDVDLWLRLTGSGFRCIYNAGVQAVHHECETRGIDSAKEMRRWIDRLQTDWGHRLRNDPFYNPNLPLDNEQFRGFRHFSVEECMKSLGLPPSLTGARPGDPGLRGEGRQVRGEAR